MNESSQVEEGCLCVSFFPTAQLPYSAMAGDLAPRVDPESGS